MADQKEGRWPSGINAKYFSESEDAASKNLFHVDYLKNNFKDFARNNLFKVEFELNPKMQARYNFISPENTEKVSMTAKSVNFPAYDMGKQEIKRMGQRIFLPATMNTGECQFTFISDDTYKQRKFLHSWFHKSIYNYDTNVYRSVMGMSLFKIIIHQLDNKFNVVFTIELGHCWPSSIGEIQLSHDSENQVTDFPATFAYSTYKILTPDWDINDV